jgi:DNA repair exonuclease SbcCD nuclease subunit
MQTIIAIFVSDLHLSHTAPIWRSDERDWYAAQEKVLEELWTLQEEHDCPVFCAGDIFDVWKSPPELINWALEHLPPMYSIPGQHDLPNHNLKEIRKSAYWTLVQAGKITPLGKQCIYMENKGHGKKIFIHGFPYGKSVKKKKIHKNHKNIAVIHEYNWIPKYKYTQAPATRKVTKDRKEFTGYHAIVCGDNHRAFQTKIGKTLFFNCGGAIRRDSNESEYIPRVGLLEANGNIVSWELVSSNTDVYMLSGEDVTPEKNDDMDRLMKELEKIGDAKHNFALTINQYMDTHDVDKDVRQIILKALGE